jgi:hypothetical protein
VFGGSFDEFPGLERGAGSDERDEVPCVYRPPPVWATSMSVRAIASPADLEPGPSVTFASAFGNLVA